MDAAAENLQLTGELAACLTPLRELARLARRVNLTDFEDGGLPEAQRLLRPLLDQLSTTALSALARIAALAENAGEAAGDDWLGLGDEDPAGASAGSPRGKVVDICSVARLQISQRLEQLRQPAADEGLWAFLALCNQSRGALIQAAGAVEAAVCEWKGLQPELDSAADLENAIAVRRVYQEFRRAVTADGEPTLSSVGERLRQAHEATITLMESPSHGELRVGDRWQLRRLEERIKQWFDAGATADPLAGLRLWQDLAALSEIMLQVNNRQELIEHDRAALLRILDLLYNHEANSSAAGADMARDLERLFGRDEQLDQLVLAGTSVNSTAFVRAVTRAAVRVGAAEANRVILGELS